ncbi:MAG: UPF0175 family protein [Proteobacteria bacterium]|nr:UPF0175 family protein [Pseudomonadota bacterium]
MSEVKTTINLPSSFPISVKIREDEIPNFIKRTLAIELYREGKLSLGKAAELAGARNKWEMLIILDNMGVALNYTVEDAKEDLSTLEVILA